MRRLDHAGADSRRQASGALPHTAHGSGGVQQGEQAASGPTRPPNNTLWSEFTGGFPDDTVLGIPTEFGGPYVSLNKK